MIEGIPIRRLGAGESAVLERIAPELFDRQVDMRLTREFLADPRHHLFVASDDDCVVGFVSGVHYVHPDKPAQMFINEVSITPAYRRRGIARALLDGLLDHARSLGCGEAWVLTERGNRAARHLYANKGGGGDGALMFTFPLDLA